jgi:hypothetical protein
MRTEGLAEVDGRGEFAVVQIDDVDSGAVRAGSADAGIAVDGNEGEAGVGGNSDFVAVDADRDFREFLVRLWINEQGGVLMLVGYN